MKKFLFSLLAIVSLFGGSFAFAYTDGGKVNVKESSGGDNSDPVRVYQLVRYPEMSNSSLALSSGDVVFWDVISDDGVTINVGKYLNGSAPSSDAVAGVVVGSIPTADAQGLTAVQSIGKRNWGYIQTYGYNSDCQVSAAVNAGEGLIASQTVTGFASPRGTIFNQKIFGFAYDTESGANPDAEVFIDNR